MLLCPCPQELLDKCHPLGMFDSIATLAVASSMRELYRLVLVDTPLAPYFSESLSAGLLPHNHLQQDPACQQLPSMPRAAGIERAFIYCFTVMPS